MSIQLVVRWTQADQHKVRELQQSGTAPHVSTLHLHDNIAHNAFALDIITHGAKIFQTCEWSKNGIQGEGLGMRLQPLIIDLYSLLFTYYQQTKQQTVNVVRNLALITNSLHRVLRGPPSIYNSVTYFKQILMCYSSELPLMSPELSGSSVL